MRNYVQMVVCCLLGIVGVVFSLQPTSVAAELVKAPSWQGTEWINLDEGRKTLDVSDLKGQVIYLAFFQKW